MADTERTNAPTEPRWDILFQSVRSMTTEQILADMEALKKTKGAVSENPNTLMKRVLHVMQEVLDEREYGMSFAGYGE